jgi:integrase
MRGQIVRRGKRTWLVRVSLGRDAAGTRKYHSKTVHGAKTAARRYLVQVQRELDTATFVQASPQPLATFVEEWFTAAVQPRVRARTLADYRALLARHVLPTLGTRRLSQLTASEIQAAYATMLAAGLAARTVRYVHAVLHAALAQAVKWQQLARNPATLVALPRPIRREPRVLDPEQAARFLAAAAQDRDHALWALLLTAGLRPGEALALKWSDLDGHRLRVQRSLARETRQLDEPKTARGRRVVVLPPSMLRLLQQHRRRQAGERLTAGAAWQDLDLIFATPRGEPLHWHRIARRFARLLRVAHLPRIRPYDLRHTCATLLLAAGENVKVVSERLGHASAALTLDVYSHVLPDMQQRAAEKLESLLFATSRA